MVCYFFFVLSTPITWINTKIELLPLVQPNLGESCIVVVDDLRRASREHVRRGLAEDVTHVGTCRDHQFTATHPNLDGSNHSRNNNSRKREREKEREEKKYRVKAWKKVGS